MDQHEHSAERKRCPHACQGRSAYTEDQQGGLGAPQLPGVRTPAKQLGPSMSLPCPRTQASWEGQEIQLELSLPHVKVRAS